MREAIFKRVLSTMVRLGQVERGYFQKLSKLSRMVRLGQVK